MLKEVVLALTLSGCAYPSVNITIEPKPDQDKALSIVWSHYEEYYGECINRLPPTVAWTNTATFPCRFGSCYGLYITTAHLIIVGWRGSFSNSSFAHEICHAVFGVSHETCNNDLPPIYTANIRLARRGL